MAVKYVSKYTGAQIDKAVKAIIENDIQIDDLSPALIETIKGWISSGSTQVVISRFDAFPAEGDSATLYLALDKKSFYIWDTASKTYISFTQEQEPITLLDGGNANL